MLSDPVLIAIVSAGSAFGGAFLAMLPQLVVAMRTQRQVDRIHTNTNSLVDKLVTSTRNEALQEGHTLGVADEKQRAEG